MFQQSDMRRLVHALQAIDGHLPHERPLPEDAPRPAWCAVIRDAMGVAEGECCGVCGELSEVTVAALNAAWEDFAKMEAATPGVVPSMAAMSVRRNRRSVMRPPWRCMLLPICTPRMIFFYI